MMRNSYQNNNSRNTSGGKRQFVEDPYKAVFLSGFRTDVRKGDERQYREEVYQDINKKYQVYIKKLDLPVNCKYGYLHLAEKYQAEKLLNLKIKVKDVDDKMVPEMILAGDSIKVYEYKKTQKRRDEENFVSSGGSYNNYHAENRDSSSYRGPRSRDHGYNPRDRHTSRDHSRSGYVSYDHSRSGTPSYSQHRSRNVSQSRSNDGHNSNWRKDRDFVEEYERESYIAPAGLNFSQSSSNSSNLKSDTSNYCASSPMDSAHVTQDVSEDELSADFNNSMETSKIDWATKQLSVIASGDQGDCSLNNSLILPSANTNIGHIDQDMCNDQAVQTSNVARSPETAPILTQVTVIEASPCTNELKTEKSNESNPSSDVTVLKQASVTLQENLNLDVNLDMPDNGFTEGASDNNNVYINDQTNCLQDMKQPQIESTLVMNQDGASCPENVQPIQTYDSVTQSAINSESMVLLMQYWPEEFNTWPNQDQVNFITLFRQEHANNGPLAALQMIANILEGARIIEQQQADFLKQQAIEAILRSSVGSLVNTSMQTSLTN